MPMYPDNQDSVALELPGMGFRKRRGLGYQISGPGQLDSQIVSGAKSQYARIPEQPQFEAPHLPGAPTSGTQTDVMPPADGGTAPGGNWPGNAPGYNPNEKQNLGVSDDQLASFWQQHGGADQAVRYWNEGFGHDHPEMYDRLLALLKTLGYTGAPPPHP